MRSFNGVDDGELNINLQKMKKGLTWHAVFQGHGEVSRDRDGILNASFAVVLYPTFFASSIVAGSSHPE